MAKTERAFWCVGTGGNEMDGVDIIKVYGTEFQIKKFLVSLVRDAADDENSSSPYEYGTEKTREVEKRYDGSLYAYACFSDYHLDFQAHKLDDMETVYLSPKEA